ncbi:BTAD domain-containing putative transcriptional regulator [Nocardia sp. NPDC058519]|uniref:BTAD domain-containing putative transcriptional regulator n=1 Tax=Nocardia sp. NPDC058519 TaxID=3346535 RepID=UPI003652F686
MRSGSQAPLLIAVVGLSPRAGTTATALALAHTWPGPEAGLIVEADPAGGQLAEMVDADPYLGLASLARAVTPGEPIDPGLLVQHVQFLPGGEALLAAPPHRATGRAVPAAQLLTGPHASWRALGATVFADCGAPEPDSRPHPVLAAADACLIVVRAEHSDPEHAARRIRALTRHSPCRGIVLIGASASSDYTTVLGLPLLGTLPESRASARALLHGTRAPRRRPHLLPAARIIATALHHQLRTPTGNDRPADPPTRRSAGQSRRTHHQASVPTVYRLDQAPAPSARPRTPEPALVLGPDPLAMAPVDEPDLADAAEDAGQLVEGDLAAAPEPVFDAEREAEPEPADSGVVQTPQASVPALTLRVFGPTRILWRTPETGASVEITSQLQPRSRELLAVLALHPEGLSRGELITVLWGERPPDRATGTLTNAVSRLRTALTTATGSQLTGLLTDDRLHYRLSSVLVSVDYWDFNTAVIERRRASSDTDQAAAAHRIAELATSELASDLTDIWVEALRESARRDALNALSWLATRNAENAPRATLGLLETIVESDPSNETVWQDILRLHARLGEYAALARTYSLLTRKLADIGQTPSPETRHLLEQLRRTTK